MKQKYAALPLVFALMGLSGCIDTSTTITVKTDGSGTIEKTIILSKHLVEFMTGMGAKGDAGSIQESMLNESGLKALAAQMGPDVTFITSQKIKTDKGGGYTALYGFKDISKVKINQSPAGDISMPAPPGGGSAQQAPPELVTFSFTKGSPAALSITPPKPQPSTNAQNAQKQMASADADKFMAQMRPLYSDLRIAVTVVVQGKITETNAAYVSGSTVTLIDMDFGKILADDATFKKLSSAQTQSISDVQRMVKALPGVKLDLQDSVNIKFK